MAYTDQQIRQKGLALGAAGASSEDMNEFVKRAKAEQAPSNGAGAKMVGNLASGLLGALTPSKLPQTLTGLATKAAPMLLKGLTRLPKMTPEQATQAKAASAQREAQRQADVQRESAITQELNKRGLTPPSGATVEQKEQLLNQVKGPTWLAAEAAGQGLKQAASGVGEFISGVQAPIQMGAKALLGQKPTAAIWSPEKGFHEAEAEEISGQIPRGISKAVLGGFSTAMAPVTGAIQAGPKELQQVAALPAQGIEWITKKIAKGLNPKIDTESEDFRRNVLEPAMAGISLATLKGPKKGGLITKAVKAETKAQKFMTEILQPPSRQLSTAIEKGYTLPAVREGLKAIKGAKNFDEFMNNFKTSRQHTWNTLSEKLQPVAKEPLRLSYLDDLKAEIVKLKKSAHTAPKAEAMQKVFDNEMKDWNKSKGYDLDKAQANKMALHEELAPEYLRESKGALTAFEEAAVRAKELIRDGLAKEIERIGGKEVGQLNKVYGGLAETIPMLADQAAKFKKAVTPGIIQKIANKIPLLSGRITQFIPRAATLEKLLPGRIRAITRLGREAARLRERAIGARLPKLPAVGGAIASQQQER